MRKRLTTRKDVILKALWDLGGLDKEITTEEISRHTGLNINGLSQTLGCMPLSVDYLGGKGKNRKWKLKNTYASTL